MQLTSRKNSLRFLPKLAYTMPYLKFFRKIIISVLGFVFPKMACDIGLDGMNKEIYFIKMNAHSPILPDTHVSI